MKKSLFVLSIFTFISLISCSKKNELHIYSIIHEEETQVLTDLFTKKTGIPVAFLRASTGELVNRIIAEKDDPKADILLGGATSYHIQADQAGAFEHYVSPLAENVPDYAKSPNGTYTGFCVLSLGIGINSDRYAKQFPSIKFLFTHMGSRDAGIQTIDAVFESRLENIWLETSVQYNSYVLLNAPNFVSNPLDNTHI